jgi:autotransporter-associated beta strand protein
MSLLAPALKKIRALLVSAGTAGALPLGALPFAALPVLATVLAPALAPEARAAGVTVTIPTDISNFGNGSTATRPGGTATFTSGGTMTLTEICNDPTSTIIVKSGSCLWPSWSGIPTTIAANLDISGGGYDSGKNYGAIRAQTTVVFNGNLRVSGSATNGDQNSSTLGGQSGRDCTLNGALIAAAGVECSVGGSDAGKDMFLKLNAPNPDFYGTLVFKRTDSNSVLTFASAATLPNATAITVNGTTASRIVFNRAAGSGTDGGAITINAVIGGTAGVTHSGTGTTTLAASNTYTGPTEVNAGELRVTGLLGGGNYTGVISGSGGKIVFANTGATQTLGTAGKNNSFTGAVQIVIERGANVTSPSTNAANINDFTTTGGMVVRGTMAFTGGNMVGDMPFFLEGGVIKCGNGTRIIPSNTLKGGELQCNAGSGTRSFYLQPGIGSTYTNPALNVLGGENAADIVETRVTVGAAGSWYEIRQDTTTFVPRFNVAEFGRLVLAAEGRFSGAGPALDKTGDGELQIAAGGKLPDNTALAVKAGTLRLSTASALANLTAANAIAVADGATLALDALAAGAAHTLPATAIAAGGALVVGTEATGVGSPHSNNETITLAPASGKSLTFADNAILRLNLGAAGTATVLNFSTAAGGNIALPATGANLRIEFPAAFADETVPAVQNFGRAVLRGFSQPQRAVLKAATLVNAPAGTAFIEVTSANADVLNADIAFTGGVTLAAGDLLLSTFAPVVATPPPAVVVGSIGGSATLSVSAAGDALSFQWQKLRSDFDGDVADADDDDFEIIADATGASLAFTSVAADDAGVYRVIVTDAAGRSVASAASEFHVLHATIVPAGTGEKIPAGGAFEVAISDAELDVLADAIEAAGNLPADYELSYQWFFTPNATGGAGSATALTDDGALAGGTEITGSVAGEIVAFEKAKLADTAGTFHAVITGTASTGAASAGAPSPLVFTTAPATLTVAQLPPVFVPAADGADGLPLETQINADGSATLAFALVAQDAPVTAIRWQYSENFDPDAAGSATWTTLAGANALTLRLGALSAANNGIAYRAAVTNTVGTSYTAPSILGGGTAATAVPPALVWAARATALKAGATVTLTCNITAGTPDTTGGSGTGSFTVLWERRAAGSADFTAISTTTVAAATTGNTAVSYTTAALTTADNGAEYRVTITGAAGTTASLTTTLSVTAATAARSR